MRTEEDVDRTVGTINLDLPSRLSVLLNGFLPALLDNTLEDSRETGGEGRASYRFQAERRNESRREESAVDNVDLELRSAKDGVEEAEE